MPNIGVHVHSCGGDTGILDIKWKVGAFFVFNFPYRWTAEGVEPKFYRIASSHKQTPELFLKQAEEEN